MSRTFHERKPEVTKVILCGPTRKRCFPSHEAAMAKAADILEGDATVAGFRSYHCKFCNSWHLTTKLNQ